MKIYTRKGDTGYCSLLSGDRIPKSSMRIMAIGAIDELSANLGMVKSLLNTKEERELIENIQKDLYAIMGHLSCNKGKHKEILPKITQDSIDFLEEKIDFFDSKLTPVKEFILPGKNIISSWYHISRTVCRRAESLTVGLLLEAQTDEIFIKYLNRLSDLLFVLSRVNEH